jgi:hypothetical protein
VIAFSLLVCLTSNSCLLVGAVDDVACSAGEEEMEDAADEAAVLLLKVAAV